MIEVRSELVLPAFVILTNHDGGRVEEAASQTTANLHFGQSSPSPTSALFVFPPSPI